MKLIRRSPVKGEDEDGTGADRFFLLLIVQPPHTCPVERPRTSNSTFRPVTSNCASRSSSAADKFMRCKFVANWCYASDLEISRSPNGKTDKKDKSASGGRRLIPGLRELSGQF